MKSSRILFLIILSLSACKPARYIAPSVPNSRTEYISLYSDIAISEMKRTGIPASIKMAQAILESGDGNSRLAKQANNHFGIKCSNWTGRTIFHDDDARNECFRSYNRPEESFLDHSDFLTGRPRYASLFELDPYDYKSWARGLKAAGYATDPAYDSKLISIIEKNELYKLDTGTGIPAGTREVSVTTMRLTGKGQVAGGREILRRNRIRYIIAKEGDTYESLTREMELMRWELARYNDLSSRRISAGDIIYLQPKRLRAERGSEIHIITEGESLHQISQRYGVRLNRLLIRNYLEQGQEPAPGTTIFLRKQTYREDERIITGNWPPVQDENL
jgi:hypothetical protein